MSWRTCASMSCCVASEVSRTDPNALPGSLGITVTTGVDVGLGAGGDRAVGRFLGDPATEPDLDLSDQVLTGAGGLVVVW